jgi:hypothetical protein
LPKDDEPITALSFYADDSGALVTRAREKLTAAASRIDG